MGPVPVLFQSWRCAAVAVRLNSPRFAAWSDWALVSVAERLVGEVVLDQRRGEDRALLGGVLLHMRHQPEYPDALRQRGVTGALAGRVLQDQQVVDEAGVLAAHDQGRQAGAGGRVAQFVQRVQFGQRGRGFLLCLCRERAADLFELGPDLRHRLVGLLLIARDDAERHGLVWFRADRPPLPAEGDVVDRLVPLVLQPLGQHGDVGAERGQLQDPLVGEGALHRRGDTDTAQRHSGQGRDGDQQQQPRAHSPVLQRPPGRRGPGLGYRLDCPAPLPSAVAVTAGPAVRPGLTAGLRPVPAERRAAPRGRLGHGRAGEMFLLRDRTRHDLSAGCHGEPAAAGPTGRTDIADPFRATFGRAQLNRATRG